MRKLAALIALCSIAALASCASAPRVAAERNAEIVRALPPVACRLALTVSQAPSTTADASGLRLTKDAVGLRDAIVAHLARLNTASVVFGVADRASVKPSEADIVLDLTVAGSPPRHRGMSSGWWSSGLLWLVTWIGGLFTDDSTYTTDLAVMGSLAQVDSALIGSTAVRSGEVDLKYWDRNSVASWRFLQSLVLPPFWTSDDPEITSAALTDQAMFAASIQLADHVKRRLEEDAAKSFGRLVLLEPSNNGLVTDQIQTRLRFAIESKDSPVTSLLLTQAGKRTEIPLPEDTGVPGGFRCEIGPVEVALRPGDNMIQIEANIGGRRFARTVLIRRQS